MITKALRDAYNTTRYIVHTSKEDLIIRVGNFHPDIMLYLLI